MDTFKTKPGIPEEILITEENFANETGRQFPYVMKKNEKITYRQFVLPVIIRYKSLGYLKEKKK